MLSLIVPMGTWTRLPSSLRGGIASAVRFRSPKPEWKPSGGDDSIGIAGIAPVIGDRSLSALEEYGRVLAGLEQRARVKGAMPRAVTPLDHGRLCPLAVETGVGGVFIVKGGSYVPIGERTSDNGVRVRQESSSRCAANFPYVAGFLTLPAVPHRGHRRWTGATPGFGLPGSAFQRVGMCTPMPPSRRVTAVPESIPAGRLPSRPSTPVAALSGTTTVPAATPMRMKTPAITTLRYRCTGDGLGCNAIVV